MPRYWILNNPYNKKLDKYVNELLDKYEFTDISEYTAQLGPVKMWIANEPYAGMLPYSLDSIKARPSRLTIEKGYKKLRMAYLSAQEMDPVEILINKLKEGEEINEQSR